MFSAMLTSMTPFLSITMDIVCTGRSPKITPNHSKFLFVICFINASRLFTHDPVFTVYPGIAPGSISSLITAILTTSIVVSIVGLVALSTVCIRMNSTRRTV